MKVLVVFYSTYGHIYKSENELAAAQFQGKHVAEVAAKLAK
jgi:hypothetical protein